MWVEALHLLRPLNSSYITLQNCWSGGFSRAQRGFIGARTLHTHVTGLSQSASRAERTLNLAAQTGANHGEEQTQTSFPSQNSAASSDLFEVRGRQTRRVDGVTGVAISGGRSAWIIRHLFVEGVKQKRLQQDSRIRRQRRRAPA